MPMLMLAQHEQQSAEQNSIKHSPKHSHIEPNKEQQQSSSSAQQQQQAGAQHAIRLSPTQMLQLQNVQYIRKHKQECRKTKN